MDSIADLEANHHEVGEEKNKQDLAMLGSILHTVTSQAEQKRGPIKKALLKNLDEANEVQIDTVNYAANKKSELSRLSSKPKIFMEEL